MEGCLIADYDDDDDDDEDEAQSRPFPISARGALLESRWRTEAPKIAARMRSEREWAGIKM